MKSIRIQKLSFLVLWMLKQMYHSLKVKEMKTKKDTKSFDILNQDELAQLKGGDDRYYVLVIIDGKYVKIYI